MYKYVQRLLHVGLYLCRDVNGSCLYIKEEVEAPNTVWLNLSEMKDVSTIVMFFYCEDLIK